MSAPLTHEELWHVLHDGHAVGETTVVLVGQHGAHLAHRHLLVHQNALAAAVLGERSHKQLHTHTQTHI